MPPFASAVYVHICASRSLLVLWETWWRNWVRRSCLKSFPSWRRVCARTRATRDRVCVSASARSWSPPAKTQWVSADETCSAGSFRSPQCGNAVFLCQVLVFSESLVPTVRKALCDPLEEVREAAAKTFEQLHSTIGHQALDDILPTLLKQLVLVL